MVQIRSCLSCCLVLLLAGCEGAEDGVDSSADGGSVAVASATQPEQSPTTTTAPPISGAVTLAGERYALDGAGECRSATEAYIHGIPAAMWLVQASGDGAVRNLSLTVWKPHDGGPDRVSLSASTADRRASLSTVDGSEGPDRASVDITPQGEGARLVVRGSDDAGEALELDLRCDRFLAIEAVGG